MGVHDQRTTVIDESWSLCKFVLAPESIEVTILTLQIRMTFLESWEEFEKAAERLYLQDPMKVRLFMT